jgi:hypothetical protein
LNQKNLELFKEFIFEILIWVVAGLGFNAQARVFKRSVSLHAFQRTFLFDGFGRLFGQAEKNRRDERDQKNEEQDFRDARGRPGDSAETHRRGDDGDDEEN